MLLRPRRDLSLAQLRPLTENVLTVQARSRFAPMPSPCGNAGSEKSKRADVVLSQNDLPTKQ